MTRRCTAEVPGFPTVAGAPGPRHAHASMRGLDADPEEGSPYHAIAPELRQTLARSLADRLAGEEGTQANLMFAFPQAPRPAPSTVWEALDNLSPMAVNLLVRLFDRLAGIDPSKGLWREILWIQNQWWGGSAGLKVILRDPPSMRARLDALFESTHGRRMARDTYLGAMEHQARPIGALLRDLATGRARRASPPPDCDTWREIDEPGGESVHVCVDKADIVSAPRARRSDDVHIDWISPVRGVDLVTRRCTYAAGRSLRHWLQATRGRGAPVFTFQVIDEGIDAAMARAGAREIAHRLRGFQARWQAAEKRLAVAGKRGYDASLGYWQEYRGLVRELGR